MQFKSFWRGSAREIGGFATLESSVATLTELFAKQITPLFIKKVLPRIIIYITS